MNKPALIFFYLHNHGGRQFRLVIFPPSADGICGEIECEERRKDALGEPAWHPVDVIDPVHVMRVIGYALHKGPIPEQGIDLGTVRLKP